MAEVKRGKSTAKFALAVHGGAYLDMVDYTEERECLKFVLETGRAMLSDGDTSINTVTECVRIMEDSGLYIAGKGACKNDAGYYELDSSIMDGKTLNFGGVISVRRVKNPVLAARIMMENSPHALMSADGAENFLEQRGMRLLDDPDLYFESAVRELESRTIRSPIQHGTVGAVTFDTSGNIAAATSTGGLPGKLEGRVGDTPCVGAGTYADQNIAVSCTGQGEYFIRTNAAFRVAALNEYRDIPVQKSMETVLSLIKDMGGWGGMIAVNKNAEAFSCHIASGMHCGSVAHNKPITILY